MSTYPIGKEIDLKAIEKLYSKRCVIAFKPYSKGYRAVVLNHGVSPDYDCVGKGYVIQVYNNQHPINPDCYLMKNHDTHLVSKHSCRSPLYKEGKITLFLYDFGAIEIMDIILYNHIYWMTI